MALRNGGYAAVVAAALLMASGCSDEAQPEPAPIPERGTASKVSPSEARPNDTEITMRIRARYLADPDLKGRGIDVTTEEGVVTLTGTVASQAERHKAVQLARDVIPMAPDAAVGIRIEDKLTVETEKDAGPQERGRN
ncbi:MAG TPA: BON domain-containing protein [Vicinamibacterales bacterium]